MKKLFLTILLFFTILGGKAENIEKYLIVWSIDGTSVAYSLNEKPTLRFTPTDLIINTKDTEIRYSLSDMARFTYGTVDNTGISNVENEQKEILIGESCLIFPTLKANSVISIFRIDGTLLFNKKIVHSGEYAYSMVSLTKGIYIVTVNGVSYKIYRR